MARPDTSASSAEVFSNTPIRESAFSPRFGNGSLRTATSALGNTLQSRVALSQVAPSLDTREELAVGMAYLETVQWSRARLSLRELHDPRLLHSYRGLGCRADYHQMPLEITREGPDMSSLAGRRSQPGSGQADWIIPMGCIVVVLLSGLRIHGGRRSCGRTALVQSAH